MDPDAINSEQLAQELPIDLACSICFEFPKNPIQACTNIHDDPICRKCLLEYYNSSITKTYENDDLGFFVPFQPECPQCRAPLPSPFKWVPHKKIEDKLSNLDFACWNGATTSSTTMKNGKARGCPWIGKRKDVTNHQKECKYQPTKCPYHTQGCRQPSGSPQLLIINISDHLQNTCPYALIPCPRAESALPGGVRLPKLVELNPPPPPPTTTTSSSYDIPERLLQVHVRQTKESANDFCGSRSKTGGGLVRRKDLQTHEASCPFWKCKYEKYGCKTIGTLEELKKHQTTSDCSRIHSRLELLLRPQEAQITSLTSSKTKLESDNRQYLSRIEVLESKNVTLSQELSEANWELEILKGRYLTPTAQSVEIENLRKQLREVKEDCERKIKDAEMVVADCFEQIATGGNPSSGIGGSGSGIGIGIGINGGGEAEGTTSAAAVLAPERQRQRSPVVVEGKGKGRAIDLDDPPLERMRSTTTGKENEKPVTRQRSSMIVGLDDDVEMRDDFGTTTTGASSSTSSFTPATAAAAASGSSSSSQTTTTLANNNRGRRSQRSIVHPPRSPTPQGIKAKSIFNEWRGLWSHNLSKIEIVDKKPKGRGWIYKVKNPNPNTHTMTTTTTTTGTGTRRSNNGHHEKEATFTGFVWLTASDPKLMSTGAIDKYEARNGSSLGIAAGGGSSSVGLGGAGVA